jgi:TPP-dependent indolepyruvate ferredoxin oxidoreductase alpha subunit
LEVIEKDQAKSILRKFDREGLMHSVWTRVCPYVIGVCNCDRDCGAYKDYIEQRGTPNFFRAEYISQVDWDLCRGCKVCIQQCQFGAMFYSSALEKVYIDPSRCFGCGVCRAVCNKDAITDHRRITPNRQVCGCSADPRRIAKGIFTDLIQWGFILNSFEGSKLFLWINSMGVVCHR